MSERDRRDTVRITTRIEVDYSSGGPSDRGFIEDLSEHGMYVDTPQPLPVGSKIDFRFHLNDGTQAPVVGQGVVLRCEPSVGMALQFAGLDAETTRRIRLYVGAVFFGQEADG